MFNDSEVLDEQFILVHVAAVSVHEVPDGEAVHRYLAVDDGPD
jgi:hypothetical protein